MPHALASRIPRAATAAAQAVGAFPNAAFALVTVAVLVCGVGIANMPSSRARAAAAPLAEQDAPAQAAAAPADRPAQVAADHATGRAPRWGILESIEALPLVADRPGEFEFTVRLRDRSARVTHTVGRAQWQVGDRIMLLGGGPPTD
jgi:hypothetical protein